MIIHGNSKEELKKLDSDSIDLIFTSPPYADRRKNTYGGVSEDQYVEWFKPFAIELKRVLKPTGSFFLNIKPHTNNGERSLYVFDLIIMLKRDLGFLFVEEYCWTKNAFPGNFKGRFKNGFEPVYHFTKNNPSQITFNPLSCGTSMKKESIARGYRKQSGAPKNGSGMTAMNTTNIRNLKKARPSNVIHANNVLNQYKLVEFFVKSFSNPGDTVLDPFAGSGTTGVVCFDLNRDYILIDKEIDYIKLINRIMDNQRKEKINEIKTKKLF